MIFTDNSKIVSFGEIMLRLSPEGGEHIENAKKFAACYGGSEANVMTALAGLGHNCSFFTVLPKNELGKAVEKNLNVFGINTDNVIFKGEILGSYFFEAGFGSLSANVIYNRKFSEIARIKQEEINIDYDELFKDCKIFHISGISFALSETCRNLCFELLREAKKRGVKISFDFNYRGKLWTTEEAAAVFKKVIPFADILFSSEKDLKVFLDTDAERFYEKYACEYLIIREREIISTVLHSAKAEIVHNFGGKIEKYVQNEFTFDVVDRVGSGDAFDAGIIHMICRTDNLEKILKFGMKVFTAKCLVPGDVINMSEKEIIDLKGDL